MTFLDGLVAAVRRVPTMESIPEAALFAFIYQVLGGVEYFVISRKTLTRMYGAAAYEDIRTHYPMELQNQIRRFHAAMCGDT